MTGGDVRAGADAVTGDTAGEALPGHVGPVAGAAAGDAATGDLAADEVGTPASGGLGAMAGGEPRASASDGGSGSVGGQERGVVAGGEGAVVVGGERGAGVAGAAGSVAGGERAAVAGGETESVAGSEGGAGVVDAAGSVAGGERAAVAGGETESVAGSEGGAGVVDAAGSVAGDGRGAVASDEDAAVADGETELVAKGEDAAEVGGAAGIVAGGEPWVPAGDSGPDVATAIVPARAPAVTRRVDVLVVGAGPAGLTAAARLAAAGAGRVEVLERDTQPGGVPRYCVHGGFGTWLRPLTGPRYARLLAEAAERAGAAVRTGVSALDWGSAGPVLCTAGPDGPETVEARAVVLATGARERPRAARLVPGTRPAGVFTTGELQQAVHLFGQHIGNRAVVVGAEDVSCAAADTVRAAGAQVVALVTELPRARTSRTRARSALLRHSVPLLTETTVTELLGHGRLSGVRVRHRDGRGAVVPCDTVVFTGDFVPEHELARRGGLALDPATRGPAVDGSLHTSRPGVFAAGNLLHAAERARAAASEGVRVAEAVLAFLASAS